MTSLEARRILDKNEIVRLRGESRIFGNIDSDIRLLSPSQIISLVMTEINFSDRIKNIFDRNDTFYATLRKRGLPK